MNFYINKLRISVSIALTIFFVGLGGTTQAQSPNFPDPVADDNGNYGFVREVVPLLLGRKPKGALEVKLLGDLVTLTDRATVLRMLMETPEFETHWADQLLDILRLQREGAKRQTASCFDQPMLASVNANLAISVGNNNARTYQYSQTFNMKDLALSSIKADRVDALQRAYLYSLAVNGGRSGANRAEYKGALGAELKTIYLNRSLGCMACHNQEFSVSDVQTGWDRHHPVEIASDKGIFGSSWGTSNRNIDNFFRLDQVFNSDQNDDISDRYFPWGIDESCVHDQYSTRRKGLLPVTENINEAVEFAGVSGNDKGIADLDNQLREGIQKIRTQGLVLVNASGNGYPEFQNSETALAYTLAKATVGSIWKTLMGRGLTIENYFPRNQSQRDALWSLTNEAFLPNWSLKAVIEKILLSKYSSRRTPEQSLSNDAYELPTIIDPWVARDPRGNNAPPITTLNTRNGQGEILRAHAPKSYMRQAAIALGQSSPRVFGGDRYPLRVQRELGQFTSTFTPGYTGFNMLTMLAWEDTNGQCNESPWMDELESRVDQYNANNSILPLTLIDVSHVIKDWLLQDSDINGLQNGTANESELVAIAELFATQNIPQMSLVTPVSVYKSIVGASEYRKRLNELCGSYISSPQFLLTGLSLSAPLNIPSFRVCNDDTDCDYKQMCEGYEHVLEDQRLAYVECRADDVIGSDPPSSGGIQPNDPSRICRLFPEVCRVIEIPKCLSDSFTGGFEIEADACPMDVPRCDPRCGGGGLGFAGGPGGLERFGNVDNIGGGLNGGGLNGFGDGSLGLRCCAGRPGYNPTRPDDILGWLEGAQVIDAVDAFLDPLTQEGPRILKEGQALRFADVIYLQPGARLSLKLKDGDVVSFGGKHGVSSAYQRMFNEFSEMTTSLAERGDSRRLSSLIKEGASPDSLLPTGETLLTHAVAHNNLRMVEMLLDSGASVNMVDARANTPTRVANVEAGRSIRSLLVKFGASPTEEKQRPNTLEMAHKLIVTGPSAAEAPHPLSKEFYTEVQPAKFEFKPLKLKQRLKILQEFGHIAPKNARATPAPNLEGSEVNEPFPLDDKR